MKKSHLFSTQPLTEVTTQGQAAEEEEEAEVCVAFARSLVPKAYKDRNTNKGVKTLKVNG